MFKLIRLTIWKLAVLLALTQLQSPVQAKMLDLEQTAIYRATARFVLCPTMAIAGTPNDMWVVLRPTPISYSGAFVSVTQDMFDLKAGTIVYAGQYDVVQSYGIQPSILHGTYRWVVANANVQTPELFSTIAEYAPFAATDVPVESPGVICKIEENAGGGNKFKCVARIPGDSVGELSKAIALLRKVPYVKLQIDLAKNDPVCQQLINTQSSLVSVAIIRALARQGVLQGAEIDNALASSRDPSVSSAIICSAFLSGWFDSPANQQWLNNRVARSKTSADLVPVALALSSSAILAKALRLGESDYAMKSMNDIRSNGRLKFCNKIMISVRAKLTTFGQSPTPDGGQWALCDSACEYFGN